MSDLDSVDWNVNSSLVADESGNTNVYVARYIANCDFKNVGVVEGGKNHTILDVQYVSQLNGSGYMISEDTRSEKLEKVSRVLTCVSLYQERYCVKNRIFRKPIMTSMFQANDALHLSMLDGCDISIDHLGDVILQDTFHVWDPKKLIRQSRERRMFLFELYMVFSKEVKDSNGKAKYQYKMKMMVREHIFV